MYHQLDSMTDAEQKALLDAVAGGRKIVALHSCTAAFRFAQPHRDAYYRLMGGEFEKHPKQQNFPVQVADNRHPIMQDIDNFTIWDEFYFLKDIPSGRHILLTGTMNGENHPLAWTRKHGKGEVFYIALGHGIEAHTNPMYQKILANALVWALE